MKSKTLKIFIIVLTVFSIISFGGIYLRDIKKIEYEKKLKANVESTDLSTVTVNTHKLGETVTEIDKRIFLPYYENGEVFTGYSQDEDFSGSVTKRIVSFFSKQGTTISYKGENITSIEEVKEKLGDDYIEGIPINDHLDTFAYIDHKNNIELSFTMSGEIIMKRIEDNVDRVAATPLINYWFNPVFLIFSLVERFKTPYIFNPVDYVTLPIYFSVIMLPFVLLFTSKDKEVKKRMGKIIAGLIVVSIIIVFLFIWNIMMGV